MKPWEAISSSARNGTYILKKKKREEEEEGEEGEKTPLANTSTQWEVAIYKPGGTLSLTLSWQCLDLEFLSLHNYEKYVSVVCKISSFGIPL